MTLQELQITPVVAFEIEFYLIGSAARDLSVFWQEVTEFCAAQDIPIFKIEKEHGHQQHEVALAPVADPVLAARHCTQLKAIVLELALKHGMHADFSAKPFDDQPGSGLHVHVHLEDAGGRNVFYKSDERMSDELRHSIGGLLAHMKRDMAVFAPAPESFARFAAASNAPLTVSWGANNRTVAIRLPDSGRHLKRIEHRVAGADADPHSVVNAILRAMADGLARKIEPPAQIHGDASLEMYGLEKLI